MMLEHWRAGKRGGRGALGRRPRRSGQRGVAVITALLLTTLAVTIVASLFWQQQVQVRSMENQRLHLQTRWILRGAMDWARLILRQDGIDRGSVTTLDGVWATPLAETRLDSYIERERVEGETFDATLSGFVIDAQSRYNLANLASNRKVNLGQVAAFRRLLQNLRLDPALAKAAAEAMAQTQPQPQIQSQSQPQPQPQQTGMSGEPIEFMQVDDLLSVPGFSVEALARLRQFVVLLPEPSALNVNTAAPEVLAAVVDFSVSEATTLVAQRKQVHYFKDVGNFTNSLNGKKMMEGVTLDVKSSYFLVSSRVRLDRAALDAQALIKRQSSDRMTTTLVWLREN